MPKAYFLLFSFEECNNPHIQRRANFHRLGGKREVVVGDYVDKQTLNALAFRGRLCKAR